MNRLQSFKAYLIYRQAAIKADAAHKKDGQRYYVLPCASEKVYLVVSDRKNFRILQRKGYIDSQWTLEDVKNRCFYYTADKGGNNAPTEEMLKTRQFVYQYWFDVKCQQRKATREFVWKAFLQKIAFWRKKSR